MTNLPTADTIPDQLWMAREDQQAPCEEEFTPIGDNVIRIKPEGGLWTSTYTPDKDYPSDWLRWSGVEGWAGAGREAYLLVPKDDLNLIEVDTVDCLREVVNQYAQPDRFEASTGTVMVDYEIDFRAIADDGFDGMHLTQHGQANTRMTAPHEPSLYGWDSESTLWFQFVFESVEYLGTATDDSTQLQS